MFIRFFVERGAHLGDNWMKCGSVVVKVVAFLGICYYGCRLYKTGHINGEIMERDVVMNMCCFTGRQEG